MKAIEHRFIVEVQRFSGRRVVNFVSTRHVGPDLEIALFFLANEPSETAVAAPAGQPHRDG